ncbi:hypothetical protein LSTR_LSTR003348 [Laodelphax striatellus]|uniref:LRRCT domain-containing protein n=1 Tax=Laodelphax striatellus TaxID=195883 RepID=A0A482X5P0_LAOST|nr:hypothetical protein LSTR_LSTR003348 [Laodelphax striatellus]
MGTMLLNASSWLLSTILLVALLPGKAIGMTVGSAVHCAVRREISPCTCRPGDYTATDNTKVTCEGMANFTQVLGALKNRFDATDKIKLTIAYSTLEDLPQLSLQDLGFIIKQLKLSHNNIRDLPGSAFLGLSNVESLTLSENTLQEIPSDVLKHMPHIKTLDLGFCQIENVTNSDFQDVTELRSLMLAGNRISQIDPWAFPKKLRHLHIGNNEITDLNGALKELYDLDWLFFNNNSISTLDGQLPAATPNSNLNALHFGRNKIERFPSDFRNLQSIDRMFGSHNSITALNGALAKSRKMITVDLTHNLISVLQEDDFSETENLEELLLGYNKITFLNSSLLPLHRLRYLNLTHNDMEEFTFQEIRGLTLKYLDLSYNKISKLKGRMENLVEIETRVNQLHLEFNDLESLSGSLNGLTGLEFLNLSHNRLNTISPDDFIGLDNLKCLDISHNQLTTLEETSKTFLPSLEDLKASHNLLTVLERDFQGLPVLCWADLSYNQIYNISVELVEKTQCRFHGVNGTLRIYMSGNPVVCDKSMAKTILAVESKNNTVIHGALDCLPEKAEKAEKAEKEVLPKERPTVLPIAEERVPQPQVISAAQSQPT